MSLANLMRVGAIDVGSNSVRLLVADVRLEGGTPVAIQTVARAGEACRLGRGLARNGLIEEGLASRAGNVVHDFARRARDLGAVHLVMAATAALRSADNGAEVAGMLERRAGVRARILSGEDEARLVYRAVVGGLGPVARSSSCVVFDLGGGSTEVVSGVGLSAGRWTSLPFGAVSLSERFVTTDPITPDESEALRDYVRAILMRECAYLPDRAPLLAGVGGTITLLAGLDRGMTAYDPAMIEGHVIPAGRLRALIERLVATSHEERMRWAVMGEGRADIVVAGALAVEVILERFPSAGLVCSTQGLRYGLALLAAEEAARGQTGNGDEVRR
uniref:Ppx/GppA family phosphatase n=1 Tax=Eiseniibacteriota bacterium TaxID=2212470 RepID=A0A832I5J1_UNCEI